MQRVAQAAGDAAASRVAALVAERDGAKAALGAVHRSHSWRLTAPLRRVARLLRTRA